jgi:perosamine synthetase
MDPTCLEKALATGRTRAIIVVHAFGSMANMPEIHAVARRHGVPVIEDAACALGATFQDEVCGNGSDLACFSFHPRKHITTGEGGAVSTRRPELARKIRALRNHGQDPDAPSPDFILPGLNYRMTEFQAAIGLEQLKKMDEILAIRARLARRYDELLSSTPVRPPKAYPGSRPIHQAYVALLPPQAVGRRDEVVRRLGEAGVQATIGTWHIPLTRYNREKYGYKPGDFPETDGIFARAVTLPLHHQLTEEDQRHVVRSLISALERGTR